MRYIASILWYNPIIRTGSVGILLPVLIDCCGCSRCIDLKAHDSSKHYESHISDKVTDRGLVPHLFGGCEYHTLCCWRSRSTESRISCGGQTTFQQAENRMKIIFWWKEEVVPNTEMSTLIYATVRSLSLLKYSWEWTFLLTPLWSNYSFIVMLLVSSSTNLCVFCRSNKAKFFSSPTAKDNGSPWSPFPFQKRLDFCYSFSL